MVKIITGTKDVTYYNSNTTNKIIQRQAFGKTYIIESCPLQWEISNNSKMIGDYKCFLATAKEKKVFSNGQTGISTYQAWFTPDIPLNFGPKVLEVYPV